jgi:hypothetical protein
MNIHFIGRQKHPNGMIVASISLEMLPDEWDAFALKMHDAYDSQDQPIKEKVLRAFAEMFNSAHTEIATRGNMVVPVEHIGRQEFESLLRGKRTELYDPVNIPPNPRLNGHHPKSSKGR